MLDLGCGDRHFASRALPSDAIGADPDLSALLLAPRASRHRACAAAAAPAPWRDGAFGTVVANSVLEHIADLGPALDQVARSLRPGGRLILTSPSDRFARLLLGHAFLGAAYGRWFNRHSRHAHTWSAERWRAELEQRGFSVERCHGYFSAAAHRVFDLLHYLGAPTLVARRLTGRWIPWRNPVTKALARRWLARYADPSPDPLGAYVFVVARR